MFHGLVIPSYDGYDFTSESFRKKYLNPKLVFSHKQELAAGHKGMKYFDNIVRGCDVLMRTNHLNNTFNEPGGQNVRVTRQLVELDTKYGVKFEHLSGVLNVRHEEKEGVGEG